MESGKVGFPNNGSANGRYRIRLDNKMSTLATTKNNFTNLIAKDDALADENKSLEYNIYLIFRGPSSVGKNPECRETVRRFCSKTLGHERAWINRAHFLF